MNVSDYTPEQNQWLKMRTAFRANKSHECHGFKNMAVTKDGQLCIGMTLNKTWSHYSATYTQKDGVRSFESREWDLQGKSLDGFADLNMATVNKGVYTI
ncbi:hypothetical protein [Psychrobacter sp. I-STPA6b]|uniref:hypothetical protein n=1 Tax=Psychrobacter sp. I-STPA6b TaxID=2585718 RepID=UPI001D0C8C31|nr:hypothetical protein [Psychrobacter sp. I-STPA6b]